jgi:hypothetical protein
MTRLIAYRRSDGEEVRGEALRTQHYAFPIRFDTVHSDPVDKSIRNTGNAFESVLT